jgi:pimeloyl-ACP methyl ester carboxylesterase
MKLNFYSMKQPMSSQCCCSEKLFALVLTLLLLFSYESFSQNVPYGDNPNNGAYLNHGGVKIYYEIYGSGKPMVILHGSGGSIRGRAEFIEEFSKKYKVIALDNRCHGKTDCPKGYLTYEQIASDVNYLLDYLKIDSAMIWGHSDGGIIGLLVAINYQKKVKKLLASGANLRPDTTAIVPGLFPILDQLGLQVKGDSVRTKQYKLLVEQPHIALSDLRKIKCDVLVMAGDRDAIRNEHTLEIFNNIPGALLCILPGTTHMVFQDRRKWFTEIFYDFFDNPPSRKTTVELMSH